MESYAGEATLTSFGDTYVAIEQMYIKDTDFVIPDYTELPLAVDRIKKTSLYIALKARLLPLEGAALSRAGGKRLLDVTSSASLVFQGQCEAEVRTEPGAAESSN